MPDRTEPEPYVVQSCASVINTAQLPHLYTRVVVLIVDVLLSLQTTSWEQWMAYLWRRVASDGGSDQELQAVDYSELGMYGLSAWLCLAVRGLGWTCSILVRLCCCVLTTCLCGGA